ncbi:ZC3H3 protein, partial [Calyptomena viridis]|nr:ZC3H3 protein [Calyptomena viridis]
PSGSSSESAVTLKSEPREPLEFREREAAGNSVRSEGEPAAPGRICEEAGDASLNPKVFGNGGMLSRPAQLVATPGKSRFPGIPKSPGAPRVASTPISGKTQKFRKTNYTWVANPGKNSRVVKRWISPRAENARKILLGTDKGAKISPKPDPGAKPKKSGSQSKPGISPSKYKWKASSLQALPSTSKSAFRWRSEEQKPPALGIPGAGILPLAPGVASVGSGEGKPFGEGALSGYKVKSRTKIIQRKGNVGFPMDKKNTSPSPALRSRFHLRRKNSARGKPSATPKRSSPKGLIQVSRHRLCRMPATRTPGATREGREWEFQRFP